MSSSSNATRPRRRRSLDDERWAVPSGRAPAEQRHVSFQASMRGWVRAGGGFRGTTRQARPGPARDPHSRRVVVKARVVQMRTAQGQKAAKAHLGYLERDGVEQDGSPGQLYGAHGAVERDDFNQDLPDEKHQFRIMVSPEDGHALDLEAYVREYMQQVEEDLGCQLRWAAVNHYNTDNPHAHIVIRGVDLNGARVTLDRDYISHGMRHRAEDLATEKLGRRPERARLEQLRKEAELERYTSLDRELERRASGGLLRPKSAAELGRRDPDLDAALRQRLEVLAGLGLAAREGRSDWRLDSQLRPRLEVMARTAEGLRNIRAVMRAPHCRVVDRTEPKGGNHEFDAGVKGIVRWKGLDEEGKFVAVVETMRGVAYHLPVSDRFANEARVGQVVELKRAVDKDAHIDEVARAAGGVFALETLPEPKREAYRHRLEELERRKLATRDTAPPDRWTVRADLLAELAKDKPQPLWQALSVRADEQSLASQKLFLGPVWLDRVRLEEVGDRGFGVEVREALRERHDYLRSRGLEPDAPKLHWQLLKLQHERLARQFAPRGAAPERALHGFQGTVRVHREANGLSFLEVRSSTGSVALVAPPPGGSQDLEGKNVRIALGDKGRVQFSVIERDRGLER